MPVDKKTGDFLLLVRTMAATGRFKSSGAIIDSLSKSERYKGDVDQLINPPVRAEIDEICAKATAAVKAK